MENLDAYDGIVITHGTDTMAYTASVLSYMLQNLTKPVVLTGSQMPIDNLLTRRPQQPIYRLFRRGLPHPRRLHCL